MQWPEAGMKEPTVGKLELSMVLIEGLDWTVDSSKAKERMSSSYPGLFTTKGGGGNKQTKKRGEKRGSGNKREGIVFPIKAISGKTIKREVP
jgi:hypothetical protein